MGYRSCHKKIGRVSKKLKSTQRVERGGVFSPPLPKATDSWATYAIGCPSEYSSFAARYETRLRTFRQSNSDIRVGTTDAIGA